MGVNVGVVVGVGVGVMVGVKVGVVVGVGVNVAPLQDSHVPLDNVPVLEFGLLSVIFVPDPSVSR